MSTFERTFNGGEVIIREGDSGNTFFQLLEGRVGVFKNYDKADEVQVAVIEPGQYFGEMAVIENYPRSSTVVAIGDVKVVEIPAEALNEYFTQNPDKILSIMEVFGSRIKKMTDDCNEAKKALDDVRRTNSRDKYLGFFAQMAQQSIYLTSKNFRLERPSAEELRAASKLIQSSEDGETYNYGTIIFKEGDIGKCMYILHSGKVGIYSKYGQVDELKLQEVEPVACFGEMEMLTGEGRDTTAVAEVGDTRVEIINADSLPSLFQSSPAKIDMILKSLSYRLRSITYDYFKACKEIYDFNND
ncbi:Cyclic nucleotide-binding domain-containing protein [Ruminococcaceae bacterium R-25]|jgi:CRP-like cAMP-binding protein|nr:Cyclic nucleotide-binding domain-containing protein [Ruminococcaceae bacterium R-25]SUQ22037.1 Cyclic nucleotide-binding domain-containing protein [Oscillospiraceae bacterium]